MSEKTDVKVCEDEGVCVFHLAICDFAQQKPFGSV